MSAVDVFQALLGVTKVAPLEPGMDIVFTELRQTIQLLSTDKRIPALLRGSKGGRL
jgi:hypothetical protein